MRWPRLFVLILLAFAVIANAEPVKIIKVLPHFLDLKGRHSISPSLFDRDAYQKELRGHPEKRSAIRFDVDWQAHHFDYSALTLRIEAKGGKGKAPTLVTLEQPVKPGTLSQWTSVTLGGKRYEDFGELISWRATLLHGTNIVAEQKSFLW